MRFEALVFFFQPKVAGSRLIFGRRSALFSDFFSFKMNENRFRAVNTSYVSGVRPDQAFRLDIDKRLRINRKRREVFLNKQARA